MPRFSAHSAEQLDTCHPLLGLLFRFVVQFMDCRVQEGRRGKERQDEMVREGLSTTPYPGSSHNTDPSRAADVLPYPVRWPPRIAEDNMPKTPAELRTFVKEWARWYRFAGFVQGVAAVIGVDIRWGGDWDGDGELRDQSFDDLPHYELGKEVE